jgi:hypothetical protein
VKVLSVSPARFGDENKRSTSGGLVPGEKKRV